MARTEYYDDPDAPEPNRLVVAASAVVTDAEGRILLQRRTDNGLYALPGGTMDLGESLPGTAVREVRGLSAYTMAFIHGLLQTNDYASAVFARSYPPLPSHEVDLRAAFRLRRQHIVRSEATPFTAYIHEAALRMQFGGARIHAEQLGALVDVSGQSNISVRVVLFDADTIPLPNENFTYAEGPVQELDTVQDDSGVGNFLFDAPAHTARFRSLLAQIDSAALTVGESRDFIRSIKKDMESKYV
ncbi:Scr1 family TA system antitoxin-like transcriptional regulator [Kitasatospora sp. NPDC059160]|uniref:Scr1 family TA system antitoxin-like transcriptional regulator n=1 Tax=unclassified Kitasatospora TaxID=2633591 RepID=UPI00368E8C41